VDFDPIEWIRSNLKLRTSNAGTEEYQLARAMPGIYQPFNPKDRGHFVLRGKVLDYAAVMTHGRIMDFGPGEGFPSLLIAPFVREVVGVEATKERVRVCTENATRIGVTNAQFVVVPPGKTLPFPDASFDGVVASWSLEQSPNLQATLVDVCRLLKPGGHLRFEPETLGRYQEKHEREIYGLSSTGGKLVIWGRDIRRERIEHYLLVLDELREETARHKVEEILRRHPKTAPVSVLSAAILEALRPHIRDATTWITEHPSWRSWPERLRAAGFRQSSVMYSGGWMADRLFQVLGEKERPQTLQEMDDLLVPIAKVAAEMQAPLEPDFDNLLFVSAVK